MKNCYEKNVDFDEKLQLYFLRCTAFFIMLSEKPEYNSKIETMSALAPAVFLKHCKSPLIRLLKPFVSALYVRFQLNLVSSFIFKKNITYSNTCSMPNISCLFTTSIRRRYRRKYFEMQNPLKMFAKKL